MDCELSFGQQVMNMNNIIDYIIGPRIAICALLLPVEETYQIKIKIISHFYAKGDFLDWASFC